MQIENLQLGLLLTEGKRRVRWETKVISGRISPKMMKAVMRIVESGQYVDVQDYLRSIIRKDLEERGILTEVLTEV